MCAICAVFGADQEDIMKFMAGFMNLKHRGPHAFRVENNEMCKSGVLGYHRLEVKNTFDESIMQPLNKGRIKLICNGDIYNWRQIKGFDKNTVKCDVQMIINLYEKYWNDLESLGTKLDGVFAFCLVDLERRKILIGRDKFGVRPLYKLTDLFGLLAISSEEQGLLPLLEDKPHRKVAFFPPGTIEEFSLRPDGQAIYVDRVKFTPEVVVQKSMHCQEEYLTAARSAFRKAVLKMVQTPPNKLGILLTPELSSRCIAAAYVAVAGWENKIQVFCDASSMTEVELQKCRELAEKHCHSFNYIEINSDLALEAGSVKLERAEIEPQDHKSIESIWRVSKYISYNSEVAILLTDCGAKNLSTCEDFAKSSYSAEIEHHDRPTAFHGLEIRTPYLDYTFNHLYNLLTEKPKGDLTSSDWFTLVFGYYEKFL